MSPCFMGFINICILQKRLLTPATHCMICRPVIPIFVNLLTFLFQVNAREKIVGWYHTGPKLHPNDIAINELIKKYNSNPVLVIVDAKPKDVGLPTDAYIGIEEVHDVSKLNLFAL